MRDKNLGVRGWGEEEAKASQTHLGSTVLSGTGFSVTWFLLYKKRKAEISENTK